jgi:hypothetical protein
VFGAVFASNLTMKCAKNETIIENISIQHLYQFKIIMDITQEHSGSFQYRYFDKDNINRWLEKFGSIEA